ncbi:MAG: putative glycoside hydrolase [Patescibacteria group bacterium]
MINFFRAKLFVLGGFLVFVPVVYFGYPYFYQASYESSPVQTIATSTTTLKEKKKIFVASHIKTPEPVKAIYMTACVAGTPTFREKLVKIAQETEINSIVIDIKDYSGTISFEPENSVLKENEGKGCRVKDMREFIDILHKNGIYVIGRITVFQDPYYTKKHPDLAVQSLKGGVWKDYKGLSFIDVGAREYWDYIITLSKDSYEAGFDELNFDYIRFPSDGNMKDVVYAWSGTTTKAVVLKNFFSYLHEKLSNTGIVLSADLFGMTTTNTDDLNIGQVLENTLPYFDFVAPMVYPSHYPPHFNGWLNPNQHVYEVVNFSMARAVERAKTASTSPLKLRPWLQDFDYGGNYGETEVRAQMKATYDAGLTSWMLWDPANKYTRAALDPQ